MRKELKEQKKKAKDQTDVLNLLDDATNDSLPSSSSISSEKPADSKVEATQPEENPVQ